MSLTDDFKDGKLDGGHPATPFYVKKKGGEIKVDYLHGKHFINNYDIVEVLATCDYKELQRLKEENNTIVLGAKRMINSQEAEINRLKEALNIELLSSRIHAIWANWFLHQRDFSTKDNLARWDKQAHTRYEDLSDADKEKDRKIVKNLLFEALSGKSEVLNA